MSDSDLTWNDVRPGDMVAWTRKVMTDPDAPVAYAYDIVMQVVPFTRRPDDNEELVKVTFLLMFHLDVGEEQEQLISLVTSKNRLLRLSSCIIVQRSE